MKYCYNFSAGPSMLPKEVLEIAQNQLINTHNTGQSILEMSHRSSHYQTIHNETIKRIKSLLRLSDDFEVLFIQGGASLQFTMVPMNLANHDVVYYIDAGTWGSRAYEEAALLLGERAVLLASSKNTAYRTLPSIDAFPQHGAYLHITTNNTIEGTTYFDIPTDLKMPLIADMSSNIMSVDYDFNRFDLVYAGAQKNLGPSGVTLVIIKKELLKRISDSVPTMLSYKTYAKHNSIFNTPPTFSIFLMNEVLKWIEENGGVAVMEQRSKEKASCLYQTLDNSDLFHAVVEGSIRSLNNIPFTTNDSHLDTLFIKEAEEAGLYNLAGHKLVGGMRASLYNAMPFEGVKVLCDFIKDFEARYGGNVDASY